MKNPFNALTTITTYLTTSMPQNRPHTGSMLSNCSTLDWKIPSVTIRLVLCTNDCSVALMHCPTLQLEYLVHLCPHTSQFLATERFSVSIEIETKSSPSNSKSRFNRLRQDAVEYLQPRQCDDRHDMDSDSRSRLRSTNMNSNTHARSL